MSGQTNRRAVPANGRRGRRRLLGGRRRRRETRTKEDKQARAAELRLHRRRRQGQQRHRPRRPARRRRRPLRHRREHASTSKAKAEKFPEGREVHRLPRAVRQDGRQDRRRHRLHADHTHAVAAMLAMKAGKHVYCQKPLTHTVAEARALREAARKYKVCTQMGNQGTARTTSAPPSSCSAPACSARSRRSTSGRTGRSGRRRPTITTRPEGGAGARSTCHWDLCLGPAPERPYAHGKVTRRKERGLPRLQLARLVGLRHRRAGRHGLPHRQHAVHGPGAGPADERSRPSAEKLNAETYPGWAKIDVRVPGQGQAGGR